MENLFRFLVVVALGVGVYAIAGRPDAPETGSPGRDPDDVRRIAALEDRVRRLEGRAVAPVPAAEPEETASSADPAAALDAATALDAAIDRRLDERLPRLREEIVREYGLDETRLGPKTIAPGKPKTLEEIGEEIGLNGNEIDFIRAEREAMSREIMGIFKEEGESVEAFETRMRNLAEDPEEQARATQKMMARMMGEGGLGKMIAIQGKHDKAIRDRIGNDRYRKYKSLENGLEGEGNVSLGFRMRAESTPDDGR